MGTELSKLDHKSKCVFTGGTCGPKVVLYSYERKQIQLKVFKYFFQTEEMLWYEAPKL